MKKLPTGEHPWKLLSQDRSTTHILGMILAVIGLYYLITISALQRGWHHRFSSIAYGLSLIALYSFSSVYHMSGLLNPGPYWFAKAKQLDHIAIYLLIAGTYTPPLLITFFKNSGRVKLAIFGLTCIWGCAIVGTLAKMFLNPEQIPLSFSIGTYLFMGWFGLFFFPILVKEIHPLAFRWLFIGGLFYSFGVIFLLWDSLQFNHCIWHLSVLTASVSHYIMVIFTMACDPEKGLPEGKTTLEILGDIFLGKIKSS